MFKGIKTLVKNQMGVDGLPRRDKYSQHIRRRAVQALIQDYEPKINYLRKPVKFFDKQTGKMKDGFEQVGVVVKVLVPNDEKQVLEERVGWAKKNPEDPIYDRDFGVLLAFARLTSLKKYYDNINYVPEDVDRQMSRLLRLDI